MRSYQSHFILKNSVVLEIGKLGRFEFPAGEYIYSGSGKEDIEAKVSRHLSGAKRLRWHIDYWLANPAVEILGVDSS